MNGEGAAVKRCPWCDHQLGNVVPVAFIAAMTDHGGVSRECGACRRHTATLLAWFTDESRTGAVNVRKKGPS